MVLILLAGCGDGGPLDLPNGLEVLIPARGTCDAPGSSDDSDQGEITNPGDPRLLDLGLAYDDPSEVTGALEGVVPWSGFPRRQDQGDSGTNALNGSDAVLGQGESVTIEVGAKLYCVDGQAPEAGKYRRTLPVTSTDTLGGDPVTQRIDVLVRVE